MDEAAIAVIATFHPRPDAVDETLEVLRGMVGPTRDEPGNSVYDLYREDGDGTIAFHLFEVYDDDDALQAHRGTDHYVAYRAAIGDLLAEPIGVSVLQPVDVAG